MAKSARLTMEQRQRRNRRSRTREERRARGRENERESEQRTHKETEMDLGTYDETKTGTGTIIPAGERQIKLQAIRVIDTNPEYLVYDDNGNPTNPHRWEWNWEVVQGLNQGETFRTWTNATMGPGSAAKPVIEALLGRPLQHMEHVTTDMIEGQQIRAYVADKGPKGGNKNVIVDPKPLVEAKANGNPTNPHRREWNWEVVQGLNQGETFRTWTNATMGPGSAAKPVIEALGLPRRWSSALKDCLKVVDGYTSEELAAELRNQGLGLEYRERNWRDMNDEERERLVVFAERVATGDEVMF